MNNELKKNKTNNEIRNLQTCRLVNSELLLAPYRMSLTDSHSTPGTRRLASMSRVSTMRRHSSAIVSGDSVSSAIGPLSGVIEHVAVFIGSSNVNFKSGGIGTANKTQTILLSQNQTKTPLSLSLSLFACLSSHLLPYDPPRLSFFWPNQSRTIQFRRL